MCKIQDEKEVTFYFDCKRLAKRKGYSLEVQEDFPSWAFDKMKGGSKATIKQLLIDYLRTTFGVSKTNGQALRQAVARASCNGEELDQVVSSVFCPVKDFEKREFWGGLTSEARELLSLYFIDGMTKKEIGELFGVSEGRISQKMKVILEELKKDIPSL